MKNALPQILLLLMTVCMKGRSDTNVDDSRKKLFLIQYDNMLTKYRTTSNGTIEQLINHISQKFEISNDFRLEYFHERGTFVELETVWADVLNSTKTVYQLLVIPQRICDVLYLTGKRFGNVENEGLNVLDRRIIINTAAQAELGTGLTLWDGAVVLAKFLEFHNYLVKGKAVIELGSGTGLVGMVAALLGAKVSLLTDLPYTLDNIWRNVLNNFHSNHDPDPKSTVVSEENQSSHSKLLLTFGEPEGKVPTPLTDGRKYIQVLAVDNLDWFLPDTFIRNSSRYLPHLSPGPPSNLPETMGISDGWEVVLAADVVWVEELVEGLVHAIHSICSPRTLLILSIQLRSERTEKLFFDLIESTPRDRDTQASSDSPFKLYQVADGEMHQGYAHSKIRVLVGGFGWDPDRLQSLPLQVYER